MNRSARLVLAYALAFALTAVVFLVLGSEPLTKRLFPGHDAVELWLRVCTLGVLALLLLFLVVLLLHLRLAKRTRSPGR